MNDHGGGSEVEWNNKDEREEKVNEDILFSKNIKKNCGRSDFVCMCCMLQTLKSESKLEKRM